MRTRTVLARSRMETGTRLPSSVCARSALRANSAVRARSAAVAVDALALHAQRRHQTLGNCPFFCGTTNSWSVFHPNSAVTAGLAWHKQQGHALILHSFTILLKLLGFRFQ